MTAAIIEDGIASLCDVMLVRYSKIAQVEIPASVTNIGSQAFAGSAFFNRMLQR